MKGTTHSHDFLEMTLFHKWHFTHAKNLEPCLVCHESEMGLMRYYLTGIAVIITVESPLGALE